MNECYYIHCCHDHPGFDSCKECNHTMEHKLLVWTRSTVYCIQRVFHLTPKHFEVVLWCDYRGHLDKVDQYHYRKKKYIPRKLVLGQSVARKKHETKQNKTKQKKAQNKNIDSKRFSTKQNLHKTMFLYSKLYISHPGDICFTHAVILSLTSNFFATIVPRYNKHATARQKYDERLQFCLRQYSNGLLRKHRLFANG